MSPNAKTLTVLPETSCSDNVLWIRTAAGPEIGFGHLRRCLTLAEALRDCCAPVFLLDSNDPGTVDQISSEGWSFDCGGLDDAFERLPAPAGILIDTRLTGGLDGFLAAAKSREIPVISIHDLGLAPVSSDIAIDGSVAPAFREDLQRRARCFSGTDFMILNPAYSRLRHRPKLIRERIRSVFINLGGGNSRDYFSRVLEGLKQWGQRLEVTGIPGFVSWGQAALGDRDWSPLRFRWEAGNIEKLIFESDLAITAGGLSAYEALCAGTPLAALSYDQLQQSTISALAGKSACLDLGPGRALDPIRIAETVSFLSADIEKRKSLSAIGRKLVDGRGTDRVARIIREAICGFPAEYGRSNVSGRGL